MDSDESFVLKVACAAETPESGRLTPRDMLNCAAMNCATMRRDTAEDLPTLKVNRASSRACVWQTSTFISRRNFSSQANARRG
jgi:hypothetical protein